MGARHPGVPVLRPLVRAMRTAKKLTAYTEAPKLRPLLRVMRTVRWYRRDGAPDALLRTLLRAMRTYRVSPRTAYRYMLRTLLRAMRTRAAARWCGRPSR